MTLKDLKSFYGKHVIIDCFDNIIIEGLFANFTWAGDNTPEKESITVVHKNKTHYEIYLDEIKSIKLK